MDEIEIWVDGALTVEEAAQFARISRRTIYKLMETGRLPYSALGNGRKKKMRRIPKRALVQLLAGGLVGGGYRGERRGGGPMLVVRR